MSERKMLTGHTPEILRRKLEDFIARLAKGSHIVIEQIRLPNGAWVPKSIQARASARTFLLFNHNFEEEITYVGYRKAPDVAQQLRINARRTAR